jgi:hypothetical protein
MVKAAKMDRVSNYVSPRDRIIYLDRRRGRGDAAMLAYGQETDRPELRTV